MDDKTLIKEAAELLVKARDSFLMPSDQRIKHKDINAWLEKTGHGEPNYWQTGSDLQNELRAENGSEAQKTEASRMMQTRNCKRCGDWEMQLSSGVWFIPFAVSQ